jgi:hypothetical protein
MINSRLRARSIAAGVIAVLAAGGAAVPARAGINASAGFSVGGVLPVAKAQYFEIGPPGTASLYTPSMHDGRFTLSASAQGADLGQIVTRTSFSDCPPELPNPVLQIVVTGPRSSADVTLHVQGTSRAPDGSPVVFNQTTGQSTGVVSTLSETQLLKQCSE